MIQAGEKDSILDASQLANSPVTGGGLPDAWGVEDLAARNEHPSFPIVGIGASAGGVEALQRLFKSLPADSAIAYVVVVHLAPDHPSHLADILSKSTSMTVSQVLADVAVEANTVYVIPPNHFLTLENGILRLQKIPLPRPLSRAVDRLFISLAEQLQEKSICIVLTGADHDGTVGLKAIKAVGGMVIAQFSFASNGLHLPRAGFLALSPQI